MARAGCRVAAGGAIFHQNLGMHTKTHTPAHLLQAVGHLGDTPLFAAMLGSMLSTVAIKRVRRVTAGQEVSFCPTLELRARRGRGALPWRTGVVAKIARNSITIQTIR